MQNRIAAPPSVPPKSSPATAKLSAVTRGTGTLAGARCNPHQNLLRLTAIAVITALSFSFVLRAAPQEKPLLIYVIDVEGGQATLFVTPQGESLLIDTGWPGNEGADPSATGPVPQSRDAERILAAAKDAGVTRLDYVLLTHYHTDHIGGLAQLAERIPIGTFIDHGENSELAANPTEPLYAAYQKLLASGKYQHIAAKPGDVLPIKGVRAEIVASNGQVLDEPLPGAGEPNPACKDFNPPQDKTDNRMSVGTLFTFGKLKILDLGDLTSDKEKDLMCPVNRLGRVDIYIASHHGAPNSGSAALVHAITPHVAIVDNGSHKGGSITALDVIKSSPGLQDMWQLHFSEEAGVAHNATPGLIANPAGIDNGKFIAILAGPGQTMAISVQGSFKNKGYGWGSNAGHGPGSGIGPMSPSKKM
jgi:beta-lactamase superfamily II metal-dependent hydrolase